MCLLERADGLVHGSDLLLNFGDGALLGARVTLGDGAQRLRGSLHVFDKTLCFVNMDRVHDRAKRVIK